MKYRLNRFSLIIFSCMLPFYSFSQDSLLFEARPVQLQDSSTYGGLVMVRVDGTPIDTILSTDQKILVEASYVQNKDNYSVIYSICVENATITFLKHKNNSAESNIIIKRTYRGNPYGLGNIRQSSIYKHVFSNYKFNSLKDVDFDLEYVEEKRKKRVNFKFPLKKWALLNKSNDHNNFQQLITESVIKE